MAVLVGAGDIADCTTDHDARTAELVEGIAGTVFTAGDNAYEAGAPAAFRDCYGPTWGRFRDRTRPAAGNHDFVTRGADGYFGYFGPAAGRAPGGWYSYDAGAWHVVVLNSNCDAVGGCDAASAQGAWLAADLAAHPARCTLAIWHHPRFSSGEHGGDPRADAFWRALYAAGADVVVNGHDHDYERFAPQAPDGTADQAGGIREFVVGTGGKELRGFRSSAPNSEVVGPADLRRPRPDPAPDDVRMALRGRARFDVHGRRHGGLPLTGRRPRRPNGGAAEPVPCPAGDPLEGRGSACWWTMPGR